MADLSNLEASQAVKIAGAVPSTGTETFFADVTSEGELKISSFANVSYAAVLKTVTTVQSLASVGVSNLANRKGLVIYNKGAQSIYYGPTGVTAATGIPVLKDEIVVLGYGQNINVYVLTSTSTADVIYQEYA